MSEKISLLLIILTFVSCSSLKNLKKTDLSIKDFDIFHYPNLEHIKVTPGKVVLASHKIPHPGIEISEVKCQKKKMNFFVEDNVLKFYLSESYFSSRKPYKCELGFLYNETDFKKPLFLVIVDNYQYPSEKLKVDKKRVFLSKKDLSRVRKERKILNSIYKDTYRKPFFKKPFSVPLESFITSRYGTRRIYNNKKKGQHLGNDFRASVGTQILPSNTGRVVFAGDLFYSGNTVIIDHGVGLFTTYGHLSKLYVQVGDEVDTDSVIGLSGKTGRVTGPHLHWGVKINSSWVDGFSLVEAGR